jgi:hypothetical protein
MKLSTLSDASENLKAKRASSVCQYLTACGIKFKKKFKIEPLGADFVLDDAETAKQVLSDLQAHEKIGTDKCVRMTLSSTNANIIKVLYIDEEEA